MINRVLIRIKVVQMLYAYLLTRSEFKIETAPDTTSRDKKYAFSIYFDMLLFILELSGYSVKLTRKSPLQSLGQVNVLSEGKLAKALAEDSDIKAMIAKGNNHVELFDDIALRVYNAIVTSAAYRDFKKLKSSEIKDEAIFWNIIIRSIIVKEPLLIEAARGNEAFTMNGFEMGIEMLINTLTSCSDTRMSLVDAYKSLTNSFDKSYDLYFSIFALMIDITKFQSQRIDAAKTKYLPTEEDLNPNTRFIDNELIKSIEYNPDFEKYQSKHQVAWTNDPILLKSLVDKIMASEIYEQYMTSSVNDYASDCMFWRNILKNVIFTSDEFNEALEAQSILWNDDLSVIGTFVIKTIKQFSSSNGANVSMLTQYKDLEDLEYGRQLFVETVNNFDTYRGYINKFINNEEWDAERLAFMDIIIISVAITELLKCPTIPLPVTLNEYIEIANCYSTSKSGQFINGILFSIINYLKSEGLLNK